MLEMSRKCVPYTPVSCGLSEMKIALVSSTGLYLDGQEPYSEAGDESYRVFPAEVDVQQFRIKHGHYDEADALKDINVVFPIDRLRELAAEGVIRGVSNKHIGFKGFSPNLRAQYEVLAPAIAKEIEHSQADAVVLSSGCPLCHRITGAVQREIEAKGIPTVAVTVFPKDTAAMRPPRALHPVGYGSGHVFGRAGDVEGQRRVLMEALHLLGKQMVPGQIVEWTV